MIGTEKEMLEEKVQILELQCDAAKERIKTLEKELEENKSKWHDLREDPNDLPKESDKYLCAWEGGTIDIMDFETESNSFGYWCNIFDNQSLGFVDSEFETVKERGEDEVIAWTELPKFEEKK